MDTGLIYKTKINLITGSLTKPYKYSHICRLINSFILTRMICSDYWYNYW